MWFNTCRNCVSGHKQWFACASAFVDLTKLLSKTLPDCLLFALREGINIIVVKLKALNEDGGDSAADFEASSKTALHREMSRI